MLGTLVLLPKSKPLVCCKADIHITYTPRVALARTLKRKENTTGQSLRVRLIKSITWIDLLISKTHQLPL